MNTAVEKLSTLAARNTPGLPFINAGKTLLRVRTDRGKDASERYRKPALDRMMPVGAVCEPRLNSQRSMGSEREAGWERSRGMSKAERVAMPPDVKRAVEMVRIWMACFAAMVNWWIMLSLQAMYM